MLLALASALLLAASPAPARAATPRPPPAFVVVLDPGHGGEKEGAVSVDGKREKDIALAIARALKRKLEKQGARVVLTRGGDDAVELARRAAIANAEKADLFVSIHLNSAPGGPGSKARGVETYFLSADATDASATAVAARENADRLAGEPELDPADVVGGILSDLEDQANLADSSRLAHAIHGAVVRGTRAADRGVKQAPFYVLAGARMAAVLVELGFVSHPVEGKELGRASRQDAIAGAIAAGIAAYRAAGGTGPGAGPASGAGGGAAGGGATGTPATPTAAVR